MKHWKKQLNTILGILGIITISACTKQSDSSPAPTPTYKNVDLSILGFSKFGSVLTGDFRESSIKVTNNTSAILAINPIINLPFSISKADDPCNKGSLPSGQSCTLTVRFAPTAFGDFSSTLSIGDSSVQFTGKGLIGGDIDVSELTPNVGDLGAGVEFIKTLTLTNRGDFNVPFPTFQFLTPQGSTSTELSLVGSSCGNTINPHVSCDIKIMMIKKTLGSQVDTVNMTATSQGSGNNTIPITITSNVIPGPASGTIPFQTSAPIFTADGNQTATIQTGPITDQYGNKVSTGTSVRVVLANLNLIETSNIFNTDANGSISFHIQSTTTKGPASITLYCAGASGYQSFYIRSGLPYGLLTLQSYNPIATADGVSVYNLKTGKIYDKFGNQVEDGTALGLSIDGGGTVSSPIVQTFSGSASFTLISGTLANNATVHIRANPTFDSNNNVIDFAAKGDFPFVYIPGPASGNIPIVPAVNALNAETDLSLVTIGPVRDKNGNVVAIASQIQLVILNGSNQSGGNTLTTDQNGKAQFILKGSGNRGPITITATSLNATGTTSVWAYKNSHLTLQGQKRDDWGFGDGNNNINSGRGYIKYAQYASTASQLPAIDKYWDEIFDYNALSLADNNFLRIQKVNGSAITTLNPNNTTPLSLPANSAVENIISLNDSNQVLPYWQSPVLYSSGQYVMSAPSWSKLTPTGFNNLSSCNQQDPFLTDTFLFNLLSFNSANGINSCQSTSAATNDRLRDDVKSNLYWPLVGYAEDPLGCSWDLNQSPKYSFSLGTYSKLLVPSTPSNAQNTVTRTFTLYNPSSLALNSLSVYDIREKVNPAIDACNSVASAGPGTAGNQCGSNTTGAESTSGCVYTAQTSNSQATCTPTNPNVVFHDPYWTYDASNCGTSLSPNSFCTVTISFTYDKTFTDGAYTFKLNVDSSVVSSEITLSTTVNNVSSNPIVDPSVAMGNAVLKSNCFSRLIEFGGYNYNSDGHRISTIAPPILSLFNIRGNLIDHFDNQCSSKLSSDECLNQGFGCAWFPQQVTNGVTVPAYCDNKVDLGSKFPKSRSMSPVVAVGKKLYSFSGYDATNEAPLSNEILVYDAEQNLMSILTPNGDASIAQANQQAPVPRYQHAMVYVPDTTSLYVFGGKGMAIQPATGMVDLSDLWQLNLNPAPTLNSDGSTSATPLAWKRICDQCNVAQINYTNIVMPTDPATASGPGYDILNPPHTASMVYNRAARKVYLYWAGSTQAYYFDPVASQISFTSVPSPTIQNSSGALDLAGAFQFLYNPKLARMFSYFRGDSNHSPTLKYWDMDNGYKAYFRTQFKLGSGSKLYATVLTPRVKAYGSVGVGPNGGCTQDCPGVGVYIYNYDLQKWDFIADNTALGLNDIKTQGEISISYSDSDARSHISPDGNVDILIQPKGNPYYYNQMAIDYVWIDGTF